MPRSKWNPRMIATGAICIAMSFLLSYIQLFKMPTGGSVTAASMVPVMLFAWLYGIGPGILAGVAYGMLQFIQDPQIYHWLQFFLDYPIAFGLLGLAGCFRKVERPWALPAGIVLGCAGRFASHLVSGIFFFASYAPAQDFISVFIYSAGYNGVYMSVEAAVGAVITALPSVQSMVRRLAKQ